MPAPFQLLGAHPALDFVNTLDNRFDQTGPSELMTTYADLLSFMEQTAVLDSRQVNALRKRGKTAPAARVLRHVRDLRETLASVFYGIAEEGRPPQPPLERLEHYVVEAQRHQELVWAGDDEKRAAVQVQWTWGRFETDPALPLWAITQSAIGLLTCRATRHVHACASQTCRWLFLDTSKNHSRRWCDMAICGNRMKARRFQARQ